MENYNRELTIRWATIPFYTRKCQRCGYDVRKANGLPYDDVYFDWSGFYMICPKCGQAVGCLTVTLGEGNGGINITSMEEEKDDNQQEEL